MDKKVTVIGAGFVGATSARRIVEKDLADVVLVDIVEGLPQGKALDIMESSPIEGFNAKILGINDYSQTKDSDIVVVAAGIARKPGMNRDDLQATNAKIVSEVVKNVTAFSPKAILILVTNPVDVMSYLTLKVSGFSPQKVIGMAGIIDSSRYRYFIAEALSISPQDVQAMVLGGHGDSMLLLPRYATVKGISITQLLSTKKIEAINNRTRKAGAEIVGLLKSGSAYYAPSAAVAQMVKVIIGDENKILPCSVYLNGEYGLGDVYCGVPIRLCAKGVEEIIEIELTGQEKTALEESGKAVRVNVDKLQL